MKLLLSFIHPHVNPNLYYFLKSPIKKYNNTVPLTFTAWTKNTELCSTEEEESHTSLKQHEGE